MNLYASTLQALAPLFALILLGYALKRRRILHSSHVPIMNGLVLNITLPALVIHGLAAAPSLPWRDALPAVAAFFAELVVMLLALGICTLVRLPRPTVGMVILVGSFANTGFLGYPMTLALLKDQMPSAILLDQFGMSVPLFLSAALIGGYFGPAGGGRDGAGIQFGGRRERTVGFVGSPLFFSMILGLSARLVPWSVLAKIPGERAVGELITDCLTYLAEGTIPIVLLALGASLRPNALRGDLRPIVIASLLKLFALPMVAYLFCTLFGLRGDILRLGLLQTSMPTAVMASVLCAQNDLDGDTAVAIVFITTVLSALTVPLLLGTFR